MRHRNKKAKLNRSCKPRHSLVRNMATSLILDEKIETTAAKAKALQPVIERLVNYALKEEPREAIRKLNAYLFSQAASRKVVEVLKPRFQDRKSGFTRLRKVGIRQGDGSAISRIELISA